MGRHPKLKHLSQPKITRFPAAALRHACCAPRVAPWSDHGIALTDLNEAIRATIIKLTGREPDWVTRSNTL